MVKTIFVLLVIMFAIPPFIYSEETHSVSGVITIFQEGDIHIGYLQMKILPNQNTR